MNSSPSYTDAMCNLPQFANFPQGMHGVALPLHCLAFSRSTPEDGCRLPSCGLCATLGWVGTPNSFRPFFVEGFSFVLTSVPKPLHRNRLVSGRTPAGWLIPPACLGPCPHDPLRPGLDSSTPYTAVWVLHSGLIVRRMIFWVRHTEAEWRVANREHTFVRRGP